MSFVYKSSLGADDHIEQKNKKQGVTQMELINRMRKNRKGFTLVEIIVVLVILAILAAFTIPTMLGFVNDAKGKAYIAEAREVYVAAQATATEMTARGDSALTAASLSIALSSDAVEASTSVGSTTGTAASYQMKNYLDTDMDIYDLATKPTTKIAKSFWEVTLGTTSGSGASATTVDPGKVTKLVYVKDGYEVTITGGNATVAKIA